MGMLCNQTFPVSTEHTLIIYELPIHKVIHIREDNIHVNIQIQTC